MDIKKIGISCACGLAVNRKFKTKDNNGLSTAYVFRCKSCKQDTVVMLKFDKFTCHNCRHRHSDHHGRMRSCTFADDRGIFCKCARLIE